MIALHGHSIILLASSQKRLEEDICDDKAALTRCPMEGKVGEDSGRLGGR